MVECKTYPSINTAMAEGDREVVIGWKFQPDNPNTSDGVRSGYEDGAIFLLIPLVEGQKVSEWIPDT